MVVDCDKNFIKKISSSFSLSLLGYIRRSTIKSKKIIKNFKKKKEFLLKKTAERPIFVCGSCLLSE